MDFANETFNDGLLEIAGYVITDLAGNILPCPEIDGDSAMYAQEIVPNVLKSQIEDIREGIGGEEVLVRPALLLVRGETPIAFLRYLD
jgi:hypothetical protein